MRRHGICDGRCVARRLGPVGMIRLCACGVPASAHLLHRLEHCHTGDAAPKAEADDREGAQARADPPAGRYLQSTGVLQYAKIREYPKSTSASQCPAVGQPTPSHLLVPPRVLVPRGRLHARTVPSAAPGHGRIHCAFSRGEHSESSSRSSRARRPLPLSATCNQALANAGSAGKASPHLPPTKGSQSPLAEFNSPISSIS